MFEQFPRRLQEPDDVQAQRQMDHWRELLADEANLTDERLDDELFRLLEKMRDSG